MKRFNDNSLIWSVRMGAFNFDVPLASQEVKTLMRLNARNVDVAVLKLLKDSNRQQPDWKLSAAEDVKSVLQTGQTLREPFPKPDADPDSPEGGIPCSTCGVNFVPVRYETKDGDARGSIAEFKAERFAEMERAAKDESLPKEHREAAALFISSSDALMGIIIRGRSLSNVRLFATCPACVQDERKPRVVFEKDGHRPLRDDKGRLIKKGIYNTYLPIGVALAQAGSHDARIQGGKARSFLNERLRELSSSPAGRGRFGGGGGGGYSGSGGGGGGNRRRGSDDPRPRAEFHGASFLEATTVALVKAETEGKLSGGLEQLADASDEFLASIGAATGDRAAHAVRTIASRSLERAANADAVSTAASNSGLKLSEVKGAGVLETLRQRKPAEKPPRRKKGSGSRRPGRGQRQRRYEEDDE